MFASYSSFYVNDFMIKNVLQINVDISSRYTDNFMSNIMRISSYSSLLEFRGNFFSEVSGFMVNDLHISPIFFLSLNGESRTMFRIEDYFSLLLFDY